MLDQPVYLRIPTENEQPLFERHSCAEVVIGVVMKAQEAGYMHLHGFVVLPETLEMVATPLNLSVGALVGYIQSETIPLLSILVPNSGLIWNRYFMRTPLETQRSLDARLNMLLLSPVAHGLTDVAESYAYSSSNPRYSGAISPFTGFPKSHSLPQTAPLTAAAEDQETAASAGTDDSGVAKSES
jgi:hypothetical protein